MESAFVDNVLQYHKMYSLESSLFGDLFLLLLLEFCFERFF